MRLVRSADPFWRLLRSILRVVMLEAECLKLDIP